MHAAFPSPLFSSRDTTRSRYQVLLNEGGCIFSGSNGRKRVTLVGEAKALFVHWTITFECLNPA